MFPLDQYCKRELGFWKENVEKLNMKVIDNNSIKKSNYVIYSDASSTGCAGHIDFNGEIVFHR